MACYNMDRFVGDAISSILNQENCPSMEIIVVNDGSTDNSLHIISGFSDPRLKLISLKKNYGNSYARNQGLAAAQGKYIAVMDADDIAFPSRLRTQFEYMEKHRNIGAVASRGIFINENGEYFDDYNMTSLYEIASIRVCLLKNLFLIHSSLFFRLSLLKKHKLNYSLIHKSAEDYDFIIRCSEYFKIEYINDRLIQYRIHPNQQSAKRKIFQLEFVNKIRLYLLKQFKLKLSQSEIKVYLKMMGDDVLTQEEISLLPDLLNRILDKNRKVKIYPQSELFSFFNKLLHISISLPYYKNNFSFDWFSHHIENWETWLASLKGRPFLTFLEIGCFEGMATIWLIENILTDDTSNITVVDPFTGSMEHQLIDNSNLFDRFMENIGWHNRVSVQKGTSFDFLSQNKDSYDFVYIDGSHIAKDVLLDGILSWKLLRQGGILIFDDYQWNHYPNEPKLNPKIAIDSFLEIHDGEYILIEKKQQVCLRKL